MALERRSSSSRCGDQLTFRGRRLFIGAFKEGRGFLSGWGARVKVIGTEVGEGGEGASQVCDGRCQAEAPAGAKILGWGGGQGGGSRLREAESDRKWSPAVSRAQGRVGPWESP